MEPRELKSSADRSRGLMPGGVLAAMLNSTFPCRMPLFSLENGTSTYAEATYKGCN